MCSVRQISGAWRSGSAPELSTDAEVDVYSTPALAIAILHHTNSRLDARTLLAQYQQRGIAAIEQRQDDCTVVLFDQLSRTLVLARDEVGTTPLYYGVNSGAFAFGSRVVDVLEHLRLRTAPNRIALAAFLVYNESPFPEETYFEGIQAMPAGGMLIRRADDISVMPAPPRTKQTEPWTYQDAVAEFQRLLQQAVARRLDANGVTALFVSGGLDSSALLCLAAREADVFGVNYGVPSDSAADESRYIDALRRCGLRIDNVPFFPSFDIASAEQSVIEAEAPALEMVPLTLNRAAAHGVSLGARKLLMGTWGDQVLSPFPPAHHSSLAPWRMSALARAYHQYLRDVPLDQIRRALFRQSLRHHAPQWVLQRKREQRARQSIFDALAESVGIFGPIDAPSDYRRMVERSVYSGAALLGIEMSTKWGNTHGLDVRLPFLDRDLVKFLLTLPDDIAYHGYALKPLLRDAMKGIVPAEVLDRRDKGDYTAVMRGNAVTPAALLELLEGLRRPVHHGFMTPSNARKTLARIERGSNIWNEPGDLAAVLALDIWLRLFFEK